MSIRASDDEPFRGRDLLLVGIVLAMVVASYGLGFAAGEDSQWRQYDDRMDNAWKRGYDWGWMDGCAHYYDNAGWETGHGCGPPTYNETTDGRPS